MIFFHKQQGMFQSTTTADSGVVVGFGTKSTPRLSVLYPRLKGASMIQTHSSNIGVVDGSDPVIHNADGLLTRTPDILLTVKTADCVPIVYADPKERLVAVSHQGWKGTVAKLPVKMVMNLVAWGARLDDIIAVIGPSIGACCYNIADERAALFSHLFGEEVIEKHNKKTHLSLLRASYIMLLQVGVKKENIDFFPFCTQCDESRFYSHRRGDRGKNMVSFVGIKSS